MMTLIIGGAASGKSEYAERLILRQGAGHRTYVATMQPFDEECVQRIAKHRKMRAEKGFETVECYTGLADVRLERTGAVLLECLGNLAANEQYSPAGAGENAAAAILSGVQNLMVQSSALVIVSNDVFSGGNAYAGDTDVYLKLLGGLHCMLAALADNVCEVVCGVPRYHKGGEPYNADT